MNESSTEVKLTMTRIPKVLLAVALAAFAVGSVAAFGNLKIPVGWTVAMPPPPLYLGRARSCGRRCRRRKAVGIWMRERARRQVLLVAVPRAAPRPVLGRSHESGGHRIVFDVAHHAPEMRLVTDFPVKV